MKMFNFGKKKPTRAKTRKRMTRAERRKDWADEQLMTRAKTDPIVEAALIAKETGIEIKPMDELKQQEREVDKKITELALQEIENNDDLKKRATSMKIQHILGSDPQEEHGEESQYYPLEGERGPLDTIREYRELEKEFGSGTGALSFLKDPAVITQLLVTLRSLVPGASGGAVSGAGDAEGRTVVVELDDGQTIEMSPQAYQAYRVQREQLKLAQSKLKQLPGDETLDMDTEEQPDGKPKTEEKLTQEDNHEDEGITPIVADTQSGMEQVPGEGVKLGESDIEEFLSFAEEMANAMEGTPQQFAQDLAASAKGGNQDMQILLLFLSTVTYDQLMTLTTPYEQSEGLFQYINKLRDNKGWVEEALIAIKRCLIT